MIKLNKRLACVQSYVKDYDRVIDVGCDHAFLSIFIKQTKPNVRVVATDVKDGPLNIARENIRRYGLNKEISTILMDGIEKIPDDIDTIIISGMGASTMIHILKDKKLFNIKKIILSPNNDFSLIRKHLIDLGFMIDDEEMVLERGKFYPIIVFKRGNMTYSDIELEFGPCLIKKKSKVFIQYLKFRKEQIESILKKISPDIICYQDLKIELEMILKILKY